MKKVLVYPDKVLRIKSKKVLKVDEELLEDVQGVVELLKESENGAGLSAIQVGIQRRFFVVLNVATAKTEKIAKVFINPRIVKSFGRKNYLKVNGRDGKVDNFLEGCLSFPGFFGAVKRWEKVKVEWWKLENEGLKREEAILEGFEAIVFQHELDHLNGALFVDYVKKNEGEFYKMIAGKLIEWKVSEVLKD